MAKMTAQERRVRQAIRKMEPRIRKAFEQAISQAAGSIDMGALIDAIDAGDIQRAIDLVRIRQAVLFPLDDAVRSAFIAGGAFVNDALPAGLVGKFAFDGRHARAEAFVAEHIGSLIQGIQEETIQTTRQLIQEAIQTGRSSQSVARDITGRKVGTRRVGGYLGLDSEMAEHVTRARSILSDPNKIREYFTKDRVTGKMKPRYKLSDRRFDKTITRAIREGKSIKGRALDEIMDAHKSKALGYRGKRIARNESHTAIAAGRNEGYQQLREAPGVSKVLIRWQHNLSQEPRKEHVEMSGTTIEVGQTFNFSDAQMKYPHDPAGGAGHSIGCHCIGVYRVRFKKD